jgi:dienelactone hydrolase
MGRVLVLAVFVTSAAGARSTSAGTKTTGSRAAPAAANHATAPGPVGHWEGSIRLFGDDLGMRVDIARAADTLSGSIDIPRQGATRLPLRRVRAHGDSVSFELPTGNGLATFAGIQRADTITGGFHQAGITSTFRLARGVVTAVVPFEPAVPYAREEVSYKNGDAVFAGTLTHPKGPGPFPAALLITGSGSQDRDETILGFKPFKLIADRLSRDGVAVLRVDDRGIGGSTGDPEKATSADLAGDVRAGVAYLAARHDIDRARIGLIGHSEGGIIAPMVAADSKTIGFIVMMAGMGVKGDTLLLTQSALIMHANGASDSAITANQKLQRLGFSAARTGRNWETVRAGVLETVRAQLIGNDPLQTGIDVEEFARTRADAQVALMKSPWMRFFIDYDPIPTLMRVTCPVLAMFAEQDLQVPPALNRPPIEAALAGHRDASVVTIPDANHLFQPATSGNPALYGALPADFAPGVLDTLSSWITTRFVRK